MLTIKWHKLDFQKKWTFRKSRPRTHRKSGPYAKINCIGQKYLYDKLEVADFKYDNNFLNLKPKITQTRHFWFQVWKFFVLHKTLLNDIFKGAEYACICVKHYVPIRTRVPNIPQSAYIRFRICINCSWVIPE